MEKGKKMGEREWMDKPLRGLTDETLRELDEIPIGICNVDVKGKVTYVNKRFEEVSGYSREEIVGKNGFKIGMFSGESIKLFKELMKKTFMGKPTPRSVETRFKCKDGRWIWVSINRRIIKKGGVPVGLQLVSRDITLRRKAEEKVKEYTTHLEELVEERTRERVRVAWEFKRTVEGLQGQVFRYRRRRDGRFVVSFSEGRLAEEFGLTTEEIRGKTLSEVMGEDYSEYQPRFERVFAGETVNYETEVRGRWFATRLAPFETLPDGTVNEIIGSVRDITERKRMEENLLKAEHMAAIGKTAAMVGHDLRNPLQAIVTSLYLAREKLKSLPPQAEKEALEELYEDVKGQIWYMNKIVTDLQDYARPLKPEFEPVSVRKLVDTVLSSTPVPENVEVSMEADVVSAVTEKEPMVMGDPALLRRVFTNLVTNAVQAMPDGGKLTVRASKTEKNAFVSVEDTGKGIPEEDLPSLFKPLFTTKAKGQGFGLAVCKRLVEAHNGTITVESKVGKGSKFTVKIPLRREVT